jgi:WD40 repeat protein
MLVRFLFGEDVFLSYSRSDAINYVTALANELSKRSIECRTDLWDTVPGASLPRELTRALRRCEMLVVIASTGACGSQHIRTEIDEYQRAFRIPLIGRKPRITVIGFGQGLEQAVWYPAVRGLPISHESSEQPLSRGLPSEEIVQRISNSVTFLRRSYRIRLAFWGTLCGLVILLAGGTWVLRQARAQLATAEQGARDAFSGAEQATRDATAARARSDEAELAARDAEESAAAAEKRRRDAETSAMAARAEAEEQGRLAQARRDAREVQDARIRFDYFRPQDQVKAIRAARVVWKSGNPLEADELLRRAFDVTPTFIRALWPSRDTVVAVRPGHDEVAVTTPGGVVQLRNFLTGATHDLALGSPRTLVWNPDGTLLAFAEEDHVQLLSPAGAPRRIALTSGSLSTLTVLTWSHRGASLAVANADRTFFLDPSTAAVANNFAATGEESSGWRIAALTFTPDDGYLVRVVQLTRNANSPDALQLIDVKTGRMTTLLTEGAPRSWFLSSDGRYAGSTCPSATDKESDCTIRIHDLPTGRLRTTLPINGSGFHQFGPDGSRLMTGYQVQTDEIVQLWDVDNNREIPNSARDRARLRLSPRAGPFAQGTTSMGAMWIADWSTGRTVADTDSERRLLDISTNGPHLLLERRGQLATWQFGRFASTPLYRFQSLVRDASFSVDNRTMVLVGREASGASSVTIADLLDRRWQTSITTLGRHARVSVNGNDVAIAKDTGIYLYQKHADARIETLLARGPWTHVAENPRHGWIGMRRQGKTTEAVRLRDSHRLASIDRTVFPTQDGQFLIGDETKETLTVVDLDRETITSTPRVMSSGLLQTAWCSTPQHCLIVLANEDAARLYDTARKVEVLDLGGPDRYSFSPDGQHLVTARAIWHLPTARQIAAVPENSLFVAFGGRADAVLTASGPSLFLTRWRPRDLLDSACRLLANNRQDALWAEIVSVKMLADACDE